MYDDGLARFSVFLEPLNGAVVTDTRTQLGPTVAVSRRLTTPDGEMMVTVELKSVVCGTELRIVQEGIPAVIPVEMCYLGWQESLEKLTRLVEPDIPDHG